MHFLMIYSMNVFSRDEATLKEGASVGPSIGRSVRPSVTLSLLGILGATYGRVSGLVFVE